ncbi:SAM-dependent methyltransferase [Saccharibacillus alkalitolerans]|uniref:Methyltransferase domain-containing protein n=1 Tax=Saccharibacillus alkalitolerans TaxID=2705290 RepID=A0ABX0F1Q9_9BACL|nr:SAM-dependent methyltransferase [Saccharibacillus alkalitolerans]NGZ74492.1 methyltransferase domain-containing protein [Saccharibacillus alkalitolerans]
MNEYETEHEQEKQDREQAESVFICTANRDFAAYAQEELRRLFGSVKSSVLSDREVLLVKLNETEEAAARKIADSRPIFLRHIQPVQFEREGENAGELLGEAAAFVLGAGRIGAGVKAALQVRKSADAGGESAPQLKEWLEELLRASEAEFVSAGADWIVSVYLTASGIYAGISRPEDNLSDWSGGAVRFRREEGQLSRAKFKLLEAEREFGLDLSAYRAAVDIGAAPGGWTSLLLERGLKVTAVDPAKLHPSLLKLPNLTYIRKNAGEVKFRDNEFDLLVCDMSWSPKLMVQLVTGLLHALAPGGTAIVTIKLMHKKPMALIKEVIASFEDSRLQVQRAKQLFHNREEITLYMIKY